MSRRDQRRRSMGNRQGDETYRYKELVWSVRGTTPRIVNEKDAGPYEKVYRKRK